MPKTLRECFNSNSDTELEVRQRIPLQEAFGNALDVYVTLVEFSKTLKVSVALSAGTTRSS